MTESQKNPAMSKQDKKFSCILKKYNNNQNIYGPCSCDVCDIQKDIFEGKSPQNLDFKKQKWKVILNISNRILKKKEDSVE